MRGLLALSGAGRMCAVLARGSWWAGGLRSRLARAAPVWGLHGCRGRLTVSRPLACPEQPFFLFCGPNVLQGREHALRLADRIARIKDARKLEVSTPALPLQATARGRCRVPVPPFAVGRA